MPTSIAPATAPLSDAEPVRGSASVTGVVVVAVPPCTMTHGRSEPGRSVGVPVVVAVSCVVVEPPAGDGDDVVEPEAVVVVPGTVVVVPGTVVVDRGTVVVVPGTVVVGRVVVVVGGGRASTVNTLLFA